MHKSQVFLYFLLAFIIGVGVGSFVFLGQVISLIFFIIGALGVLLFWRKNWLFVVLGFSLIFFVFGAWKIETAKLDQGILSHFVDATPDRRTAKITITLRGYITEESQISGDNQKLILNVKEFSLPDYINFTQEKVLVTVRSDQKYYYGQTLTVTGVLQIPDFQEGEFNYQNYLAKDGIYTTMFASKIEPSDLKLSLWEQSKISLFSRIFKVKSAFEKAVNQSVAQPNASFINGILLGSKAQIPQDLQDAFARTSTTHILAISGYNITVVAEIISLFLLLFLRRPVAFWFSLLAIFIFTIMTGAQASVVRAAIMGMLVLLARREGRFYNVNNALVFVAALMIYINPMVLRYDVGFQLSFAATMGLVFISPKIEKLLEKLPAVWNLKETLIMSLSAQIMVLPLLLYYFKSLSLVALPANLLVLPTIPYAMLLGFLSGVVTLIWPFAGSLIGYLAWLLSSLEIIIVRGLSSLSFAAIAINFHWVFVILSYVVISGYIYYSSRALKSSK